MAFDVSSIFAEQVKAVSKSDTGRELVMVDIDELVANDANFYAVEPEKLEELKNSIALSGVMDPPTVTKTEDGKYRLISGHRRTAAVRALVKEGRDDLRKMPVFVRSPRSAAMEELELIMANSTARVLTSAEISKAAQRVERLLYDLKEQGVEFPGRMRDHVAEACNVSRTKLANLHTIESGLIADFKALWSGGKIPDATALELARCEIAFQMRLRDALGRSKAFPTAQRVATLREMQEHGTTWQPDMRCPDGSQCSVSRGNAVLRHDALCSEWDGLCAGKTCCFDCKNGAKCKYTPCDSMCSKAKQYRHDKKLDEAEKAESRKQAQQRQFRAEIQKDAQRIVRAADAAGTPEETKLAFLDYRTALTLETVRQYAAGDWAAAGEPYFYGADMFRPDARKIPKLCEQLGCSADYLLGLTDDLLPVSKSDTDAQPEGAWRTDTDYPDGPVLLLLNDSGARSYETDTVRNGRLSFYRDGQFGTVERWMPLPPIGEVRNDGDI